jgi:hypothetical protein
MAKEVKRSSFVDKLLNLTEDRKQTTTVTPSFLEALAPILSILMFSGTGEGIEKMLGMGKSTGMLPSSGEAANQAAVQNAAAGIVGDIRGTAPVSNPMAPSVGNNMTPEQIKKILQLLPMLSTLGI